MEFTDVGICACGQPIAVSTKDFAVIHKLPQCEQFKQLEPDEFLAYVRRNRGITDEEAERVQI